MLIAAFMPMLFARDTNAVANIRLTTACQMVGLARPAALIARSNPGGG